MQLGRVSYALLTWLIACSLTGQADYNAYYRAMNPAHDSLPTEEKLLVLQDFLKDALAKHDTVRIIHGNLYLASIAYRNSEFPETINYLLAAERLAKLQDNKLLLGRVYHRKGAMYITLEDYERARQGLELATEYHQLSRDSQYLGITYEQLGALYGYIDSFDVAEMYYELALPIIEQHGSKRSLAVTFVNYGNVLSYQDSINEAIRYYQQALALNQELGDEYQAAPCLNNLATEYRRLGRYKEALSLLYEAIHLNRTNGWLYFLNDNYDGLAIIHEDQGQFDSAVYYHHLYEQLSDSIYGPAVQLDIYEKEAKLLVEEQEEKLLTSVNSRTRSLLRWTGLIILMFGLGLLVLWKRSNQKDENLRANQQRLAALSKELQTKAERLNKDNETSQTITKKALDAGLSELYDTKILKTEDWSNFKFLFEKTFPGYLNRLRATFPDLSEAEERLFLLLKLNLTTREIANMLGIQQESVKKTRTRLRKRLQLERTDNLMEFIKEF